MRTTVTLDEDVERTLRDVMHRSRKTFKETLNSALRAGLGLNRATRRKKRFAVKARPLVLQTGIDPAGLNKLADELEAEAFVRKIRRPKKT